MNDLVVSSDRTFSRAIFGLNKIEVYNYLNQISGAYEELQLQAQILREQNDKLSDSNRDNALKLYNLQSEITEAQRKTDKANVELDAAKKQIAALKKELEDARKDVAAAERRINALTNELIKTGGSTSTVDDTAEYKISAERKLEESSDSVVEDVAESTVDDYASEETAASQAVDSEDAAEGTKKQGVNIQDLKIVDYDKEPSVGGGFRDIFADMRKDVATEKAKAKKKEEEKKEDSTISSANNFDDEEVYAGEVEIKVDESMLIGNEDDEDEGFNFL